MSETNLQFLFYIEDMKSLITLNINSQHEISLQLSHKI